MRRTMRRRIVLTACVLLAACGDDASNDATTSGSLTTALPATSVPDTAPTSTAPEAPAQSATDATSLPPMTSAPSPPPTMATATTEPALFEAVIDSTRAAVFGHRYFDTVDVDTFASNVSAILGSTTWDTGWQPMPSEFACTGNQSFRTVWWGDLRLTFATGTDSEVLLTAWTLGDPSVSTLAPLGSLPPSTEPATGIATSEGIGLGTSLADLESALGDRWYNVSDGRVDIPGALVTSFLLDDEQRVSAIGSGRVDCIDESTV